MSCANRCANKEQSFPQRNEQDLVSVAYSPQGNDMASQHCSQHLFTFHA